MSLLGALCHAHNLPIGLGIGIADADDSSKTLHRNSEHPTARRHGRVVTSLIIQDQSYKGIVPNR